MTIQLYKNAQSILCQNITKMKNFIWTFICIYLSLIATKSLSQFQPRLPEGQQVPCFFIFGDSLVDNGNNNGILTLARANYRPYGIDFPQGATGRFTNGRTYVDALGNKLILTYLVANIAYYCSI